MLASNTVVIPYTESTIFKKEFPYEGFSNYGNLDGTINSDSTINDNLISASSGAACAKVYGIDGLFCAPGVADKPIDKQLLIQYLSTHPASNLISFATLTFSE